MTSLDQHLKMTHTVTVGALFLLRGFEREQWPRKNRILPERLPPDGNAVATIENEHAKITGSFKDSSTSLATVVVARYERRALNLNLSR